MLSARYYQKLEKAFLELCPNHSGHMNMGLWPAISLEAAQERLITSLIEFYSQYSLKHPQMILDGGSGWGATRKIFRKYFPNAHYLGVNSSQPQIEFATKMNSAIPNTNFLNINIESLSERSEAFCDTAFFSIEAAFHFQNKENLFKALSNKGVMSITLADICLLDSRKLKGDRNNQVAFRHAWSRNDYLNILPTIGFPSVHFLDVTKSVFQGFVPYLKSICRSQFPYPIELEQFLSGFTRMEELASHGELSYLFIHAQKEAP